MNVTACEERGEQSFPNHNEAIVGSCSSWASLGSPGSLGPSHAPVSVQDVPAAGARVLDVFTGIHAEGNQAARPTSAQQRDTAEQRAVCKRKYSHPPI